MQFSEATMTAVTGIAFSAAAPIVGPFLAQAGAAPDLGTWGQVGSTIVSTGFAVWYAWFVTTKSLPEKDRLHRESIDKIVADFHEESMQARQMFRESLAEIKSSFRCHQQGQGLN